MTAWAFTYSIACFGAGYGLRALHELWRERWKRLNPYLAVPRAVAQARDRERRLERREIDRGTAWRR